MIGKTLNHYRVESKLGHGGMGEVYVAEDSILKRKVALKILPSHLAGDSERRGRFEREARVVAGLNHPNIVTLHSVEQSDASTGSVHFLTMELIEGTTLSAAIPEQGVPLATFFALAVPMADAICTAHKQGIIHRDLKPDNIMVTRDGRPKVLDFGLAHLRQEEAKEPGESQFPTVAATEVGVILGTMAYMSPEQAEGRPLDQRSDIFSLGILLYQMATGQRPFQGDTQLSILTSILRDAPTSVVEVRQNLPRHLARIIHRCLSKDPETRFQTAQDLRNELVSLKEELDSGALGSGAQAARRAATWRWPAAVAALVAVAALTWGVLRGPASPSLLQASFRQLTDQPGMEVTPSLSPDGKSVAYVRRDGGDRDIFLQRVGGQNPVNLTEDAAEDDVQPAFSPDGETIAFRSGRQGGGLFVMGATGELVRKVTDFGFHPAWSPDGKELVFGSASFRNPMARASRSELHVVNLASGETRLLHAGDAVQPHWSPNGQRIAFWGLPEGGGQRDLWTVPAAGGEASRVTDDVHVDWNPVWSGDGRHLYFSSDRGGSMNLWRVRMDEASGRPRGEPEPVTTGVSTAIQTLTMARDGSRIAYAAALQEVHFQRLGFDPATEEAAPAATRITRIAAPFVGWSSSPDGSSLAYFSPGTKEDIFLLSSDGSQRRQLTDDPHKNRWPRFSPDGSEIAFYSDRSGSYEIWSIRPDGSGLRQLTDTPGQSIGYPVWSPDGSLMAYHDSETRTSYLFSPNRPWAEQSPQPLPPLGVEGEGMEAWSWSPDGKLLAGTARWLTGNSTGIVLFSLETLEYRRLTRFGSFPAWLDDGRLVFVQNDSLYLLDVESEQFRKLHSVAPDGLGTAAPAPDGQSLFLTALANESDIWVMDIL